MVFSVGKVIFFRREGIILLIMMVVWLYKGGVIVVNLEELWESREFYIISF